MTPEEKQAEDEVFFAAAKAWRRQWEHLPRTVAQAEARRGMYARWRGEVA